MVQTLARPAPDDVRPSVPEAAPKPPPERFLLTALVAGAGLVHAAMVPSHVDEWAVEGIVFALVAWFQLGLAYALWTKPADRAVRYVAVASSLVLAGLWLLSRTKGLPVGPDAGIKEQAQFVDLVCVGLELGVVVVVAALPRAMWPPIGLRVAWPLAALALATVAVASPSARNHAHGALGQVHGDAGALTNGFHHHDDLQPYQEPTLADAKLLGEQLAFVREVTMKYPTVGDAVAAGFYRHGEFVPGQGAHYFPPGTGFGGGAFRRPTDPPRWAGQIDMAHPAAWLYAGTRPTSPVVGVMYAAGYVLPTEDFAGPNDRWHQHSDVCIKTTPEPDGHYRTISESEGMKEKACTARGGRYLPSSGYLMHVWTVPGWESPIGVFSHDNPIVQCTDGKKPDQVTHGNGGCEGLS